MCDGNTFSNILKYHDITRLTVLNLDHPTINYIAVNKKSSYIEVRNLGDRGPR